VKRKSLSAPAAARARPSSGPLPARSSNGDGASALARVLEIRRLVDAARAMPDVRVAVVRRLRESLQTGRYRIDDRSIALRLIDECLDSDR
jgi:anti-sigma28 factor (negative regulator of flagellin synthesis)